jgi:hypothetical protein
MTIALGSLPRRTPKELRSFVRAQHVDVARQPDGVSQRSASSETYWRYLVRRVPLEGVCVYYQTYDASGDENDWNLNIAPGAGYEWLLDPGILQALSLFSGAPSLMEPCAVKCKEGYQVIEAELTPDDGLHDTFVTAGLPISPGSWWPNKDENQGEGPTGQRVGVYGVFCGDYGHGGRPEIHPFDGFWRQRHRDGRASTVTWDFGAFQDDSNRFNSTWSSPPVDMEFSVPFCVDVPVSLRSATKTRARFVLARSDLCSVVGRRTRSAGGADLAETFTAHTVRLNPRLVNEVEVTVSDTTGLPGRPFTLGFDDLRYTTTTRIGLLRTRAWLSGRITIRVAVEQDGFAYWNVSGPNSTSAADAVDAGPDTGERAVDRGPVLAVTRDGGGAGETRVRLANPVPNLSADGAPSISVEVQPELIARDGDTRRMEALTIRPRESAWVLDDSTGRWIELESFDLFAIASRSAAGGDAEPQSTTEADIAAVIEGLAGLRRPRARLHARLAMVQVEEAISFDIAARYVPYRNGEVMGEERSSISDHLNAVDTGPARVARADAWVSNGRGPVRRLHHPSGTERVEDRSTFDLVEDDDVRRLVVGGLGGAPAVVRLEATVEDRFGLRAPVSALAANFRVLGAARWVEDACGVSRGTLRQRLRRAEAEARTSQRPTAHATTRMLGAVVGAIEDLDSEGSAPAVRVAGAVALTRRVEELVESHS